jgi:hypothetical protein
MDELLTDALQKALAFLEVRHLKYAIIGGIALSHWGIARYTHDVDLKVLVPDLDYQEVRKQILAVFPQRARVHAPDNPLIIAVNIDEVIVDFLLAIPGYEHNIIERAVRRDFGGWSAWICSAEDLIVQKVVAGRSKDWPDVESLLIEQWDNLDHHYIEDWLSQFAEALENPELLVKYHQIRGQVESLRNSA